MTNCWIIFKHFLMSVWCLIHINALVAKTDHSTSVAWKSNSHGSFYQWNLSACFRCWVLWVSGQSQCYLIFVIFIYSIMIRLFCFGVDRVIAHTNAFRRTDWMPKAGFPSAAGLLFRTRCMNKSTRFLWLCMRLRYCLYSQWSIPYYSSAQECETIMAGMD